MKFRLLLLISLLIAFHKPAQAQQEVSITNFTIDENGQSKIEVASSPDYYYVLYSRPDLQDNKEYAVSMTLGKAGTTILKESLAAISIEQYRVVRYRINNPEDIDNDGINDIEEFNTPNRLSPLNPAKAINYNDGTVSIQDRATFQELSYQGPDVLIDTHLSDLEYVKFFILDTHTDNPKVYFLNTVTHRAHFRFASAIGIPGRGEDLTGQIKGEIIYHPKVEGPNGELGVYRFEYQPNDAYPFELIQLSNELLAANMPFLENNFAYFPMPNAALPLYQREKELYDESRVQILLADDIFDQVDYIPLNHTEGYGLLRVMTLEERPNPREVVVYEALPNELPRVGGIITTTPQTPLSHVNLRAIQDQVPNAYIRKALDKELIADLVGKYVYYKVKPDTYEIREATLEEVNAHYANLRPTEPQTPIRDLSVIGITPLDEITFAQSSSFGVKAANVATMRTFGFPNGTIPNGFGIPFYFYDEFMKYNGLYEEARAMVNNPNFQQDFEVQDTMLKAFRKTIRNAEMPTWMLEELATLQASFPEGTSIRCRSSTNNEDLPGFSGAGLYDSKTQHPEEGHISKSIKQVYASLWNFRAFDERQFYRIDHFEAAMGVLVHPNYSDEKANGVGVSFDPLFNTANTFYLNSQIGEDLVTNPDALSIPEEILLNTQASSYSVIRLSNQVPISKLVLSVDQLNQLRDYLQTIHDEFKILYEAAGRADFAMEIEYKITSDNQLAIKQARPWVVFGQFDTTNTENVFPNADSEFNLLSYPNPAKATSYFELHLPEAATIELNIFNAQGQLVRTLCNKEKKAGNHIITWNGLTQNRQASNGLYFYQLKVKRGKESFIVADQIVRF